MTNRWSALSQNGLENLRTFDNTLHAALGLGLGHGIPMAATGVAPVSPLHSTYLLVVVSSFVLLGGPLFANFGIFWKLHKSRF